MTKAPRSRSRCSSADRTKEYQLGSCMAGVGAPPPRLFAARGVLKDTGCFSSHFPPIVYSKIEAGGAAAGSRQNRHKAVAEGSETLTIS